MKTKENFLNTRTFKFNKSFVLNCRSTNIGLTAEKIRLLFGIQSAGLITA